MTRRVAAAAVRWQGHVASLPRPMRHHHLIAILDGLFGRDLMGIGSDEQGFVDADGVFMSREEARGIAIAAGQVDPARLETTSLIFSEDLW